MNIAEILKDKPQGTKLYDYLYDKTVELEEVSTTNDDTVIWCVRTEDHKNFVHYIYSEVGTLRGHEDGLQILLPSKEMHDWTKFSWKRVDILKSDGGMFCFFDKFTDDSYAYFDAKYMQCVRIFINSKDAVDSVANWRKASSKEAQAYIKKVEETFNGKFNMENLEIVSNKPTVLTKPTKPKFKPFDKVIGRTDGKYWRIDFFEVYNPDCKCTPIQCMNDSYKECVPYNEDTAKLIGTCKDYNNI